MSGRLRVLGVAVQVQLVWDDGDELTPGPVPQPVTVPLSQAHAFIDSIPSEVARLEAEHERGA